MGSNYSDLNGEGKRTNLMKDSMPISKLKILLTFCLFLAASGVRGHFDHSLFDSVLKAHVSNGEVDYANLKSDKRLDTYLDRLAQADESMLPNREEKIAFWANAYNAYTLKLITNHYPISSIMDIKERGYESPWAIPMAKVAGKAYTLDQIENEILRPKWPDPRIHYVLVCAAQSCPQLRSEAYTAEKLEKQFEEQGRWFMIHRNTFDLRSKTAKLSSVFEWYAIDFGKNTEHILATAAKHAEPKISEALKKDLKNWNVSFSEWDWRLNSTE